MILSFIASMFFFMTLAHADDSSMNVEVVIKYSDGEKKTFSHFLDVAQKKDLLVGKLPTSCSIQRLDQEAFSLQCSDQRSSLVYSSLGGCGARQRMAMLQLLQRKSSVSMMANCSLVKKSED